jgi:hypothetical protein
MAWIAQSVKWLAAGLTTGDIINVGENILYEEFRILGKLWHKHFYLHKLEVQVHFWRTSRKVAVSNPDDVIGYFHFTKSFRPDYNPRDYSTANRNEYHKSSLGGGVRRGRVALIRNDVSEELGASVSVRRLLVTASVVPSSPIFVTLMKEALRSSQTSVLTRATRRNIP